MRPGKDARAASGIGESRDDRNAASFSLRNDWICASYGRSSTGGGPDVQAASPSPATSATTPATPRASQPPSLPAFKPSSLPAFKRLLRAQISLSTTDGGRQSPPRADRVDGLDLEQASKGGEQQATLGA